jgi:glycosyltransferase involved in cell wall biosynthesis
MRIAFVTSEYITEENFDGGLANHLSRVCPLLFAKGHQVTVIVSSDREETIFRDGVEIRRVIVPKFGGPFWLYGLVFKRFREAKQWIRQSWFLNRAFASLHKKQPFDLVQYSSYAAVGLFRLKSVATVIRLSSYEPLWQTAYLLPNTPDNRLKILLERFALQRADGIFGPSSVIAEAIEKDLGPPIQVIEPPFSWKLGDIDEQPYQDLLAGKKFLLFLGTLGTLKGVSSIAEIIFPLLESHSNLYFVFVGKDDGYLNKTMMEYVWTNADSYRGRVLYLGQMRHEQIYPILSHAVAVILPSRIDNLPNSCIEAMACKRIVIGTRGASFEQLIEDGVSGFLVPIDSPPDLLCAINQALRLPESEIQAMGERAGDRITKLDPRQTVDKLIAFYQSTFKAKFGAN